MALTIDVQRAWREGGPKTVFMRSLKRFVRPAFKFGTLVFTECDLTKPIPERRAGPEIIVREATIGDVHLFADQGVFLERLTAGHRCFMGIEPATGKLTNYRWVNISAAYIPELKRYWIMKPGEAYVYDLNTLPEFRRLGIDTQTRYHTYSYLRDTGYTKICAYIHGDNHPSLRASRHFLKPVARIRYIHVRGFQPIMIGGRKRGVPEFSELL